jgi:hypothetical protein
MASFRKQMKVHDASRYAISAIESSSRRAIARLFSEWDNGDLTAGSVRYRLEAVIRSAYRSSAGVARGVAIQASGIPGWEPTEEVFNTEYLLSLLGDVRKSLREYKDGSLSRDQAISRMEHSAGVASQRGYTDQLIAAYSELEDFGMKFRKYWVANLKDNTPCPACLRLHGTYVKLNQPFRTESGEPGVYRDLQGPPRHPRCQCKIYIFSVSLENAFHSPDFESPQTAPQMLNTSEVKKMSDTIFSAARAALYVTLKLFRRN